MAQSSTKKVAKKAAAKKVASKKTAAKKKAPESKKVAAKKATAKKAPASKVASKKVAAKKTATKATASKAAEKPAAKKAASKKVAAKATESKAPAAAAKKKTAAKAEPKVAAKKTAAKKATSKKKVAAKKPEAEAKPAKPSVPAGPKITVGELEVPDHTKAQRDSSGHYMSSTELAEFSKMLSDWKQQLMEEVDRTVGHMKDDATNFPDPNDRATQEEEFSLELRTRDRERKLIKKINEAQKRIDELEYGYCETCGVEIGVGRLKARPTAELCIDCKTLEEVRERQTA